MNDWLDYKGSGSSRAYSGDYVGNTISHYSKREAEKMNDDAEARLYTAYQDKLDKLKQKYRKMEFDLRLLQEKLARREEYRNEQESKRSDTAKKLGALHAHRRYAESLAKLDKEIAECKAQISETSSNMSKNLEEQKKTQANMNSLLANMSAGNQWAININNNLSRMSGLDPTGISDPKNNSRRR